MLLNMAILAAMIIEDQVELLKKHKLKLNSSSDYFSGWLVTYETILSDTFGKDSPEVQSAKSMRTELIDANKTWNYSQERILNVFNKASYHIDACIISLERKIKTAKPMHKDSQSEPTNHYKIGIGIFWTVLPILAGAFWSFGFYVGTTKYDREKNEMYDETKMLEKDNQEKSDSIHILQSNLQQERDSSQQLFNILSAKQKDSIRQRKFYDRLH